ncbi:MAG: hypothetical protein RL560_488 [Actinomycetota bacterium]
MENQYLDQARDWWSTLHFSAIQKRGLALLAILVIAISALFVMRGSTQEVVAAPAPLEIDPIVYSLPLNARVFEAIKAAGGLAPGADASEVNQARVLRDGEQIYIYPKAAVMQKNGKSVKRNGPIMINRASAKEFESLNGIGPVLAERIVSYRKTNGPFSAIEDLLKVQGIGQNTFAKFKAKLRV